MGPLAREPVSVCDICLESVRFRDLGAHRKDKHPEFVILLRTLAMRVLSVTAPAGAILIVVFLWAVATRTGLAWAIVFVAFGGFMVAVVIANYRAAKVLKQAYARERAHCDICGEWIPRVEYGKHTKTVHPTSSRLARLLAVTAIAIVGTALAFASYLRISRPPSSPEILTEIAVITAALLAAMGLFAVLSTVVWRRHRDWARREWSIRDHGEGSEPIHPK